MKTIEQWFNELPDGYRERALNNAKDSRTLEIEMENLEQAIFGAFRWRDTPEGADFWRDVRSAYIRQPELPPLPQ